MCDYPYVSLASKQDEAVLLGRDLKRGIGAERIDRRLILRPIVERLERALCVEEHVLGILDPREDMRAPALTDVWHEVELGRDDGIVGNLRGDVKPGRMTRHKCEGRSVTAGQRQEGLITI